MAFHIAKTFISRFTLVLGMSCKLFSAAAAHADPVLIPSGNRQMATVFAQVYQVKTATEANAPKAAYGSCFVVDQSGLLVTNYHVVAYALQDPEKYHLFLMDGDQALPAAVVAFDAINDLALVKVAKTFKKSVTFAREMPESGAKIYSIGWPEDLNKSVIEGNFNGMMSAGPYQKLQMSIPLNPGMSGGPSIDEYGAVIGVNVSLRSDSQSLAFAVPSALVKDLLKKPRASYSHSDDQDAYAEEVRAQLDLVQEQLTHLLRGPSSTVSLGGWQADKPAHMIKCWHGDDAAAPTVISVVTEHCYLPGSAPVRADTDTATFHLKYQSIRTTRLNAWQFLHQLNRMIPNFGFQNVEPAANFTTKLNCSESDFLNTNKIRMHVHYCVNAYVQYSEAYNLEFTALTLPKDGRAMQLSGSFLGFSARNSSAIMRALINSIRGGG